MKKFITLTVIFIAFITLNAFNSSNSNNKIKDGSYKATFTCRIDKPYGPNYEFDVEVVIKNNLIFYVSPNKHNFTYENILNKPLMKDEKGNYYITTTSIEQDMNNKNSKSRIVEYKLIIDREHFFERE